MKQKIVITGTTGFIGKNLLQTLSKSNKYTIEFFDRKKHDLSQPKSLENLLKDCSYLFHLASAIRADEKMLYQTNVQGTQNLLKTLINVSPTCVVVFSSSFAVYQSPSSHELIDEKYPLKPRNSYGESKLQTEILIQEYCQSTQLSSIILRLSDVYGAGSHSVINTFLELIQKYQPVTIDGDGDQTRDFLFIDDVINAFIDLLDHTMTQKCEIYNICSGEETSINKLLHTIEKLLKKRAVISYSPASSSSGGFWRGDNKLAKKSLHWSPKVSLQNGLKKTIQDIALAREKK